MQGAGAGQGMMQGAGAGQGMMQGAGAGQGMMQGAGAGRMSAPGGAGFQGKTGEGTGGNGQIEHNGPLLAEQQIQKIQEIDRTDFVIQFVWIPTLEKDRKDVDPRPAVVEDTNAASKQ